MFSNILDGPRDSDYGSGILFLLQSFHFLMHSDSFHLTLLWMGKFSDNDCCSLTKKDEDIDSNKWMLIIYLVSAVKD